MTVAITKEPWPVIVDEIKPLLEAHRSALAVHKDIPLGPNYQTYDIAEQFGQLRCFVARDAGVVVGYAVFSVRAHLHYRTSVWAWNDVIWLSPESRKPRVGLRLIRFCEASLTSEGVAVIDWGVKTAHPALGRVLSREGYEPVEVRYEKRVN